MERLQNAEIDWQVVIPGYSDLTLSDATVTEDGRLIVSGCSHANEGRKIHCFIGLYRLCLSTGRGQSDLSLTTDGPGYTMCRQIRTGVSSLTFAFQVHSLQVLVSALVFF